MKIIIIGYSGAGKSTLAKKLSNMHSIPPLYLDTINFNPNWILKELSEVEESLSVFLKKNESWVIEGNWSKIFKERYELADRIIFLDFNRFFCLKSVFKRYKNNKGKVRDSSAPGCIDKLDLSFILWVLFSGRTRKKKKAYKQITTKYSNKVLVFKTRKQVNKFLEKEKRSMII